MSNYKNLMQKLGERLDDLRLDLDVRIFQIQITEYFF